MLYEIPLVIGATGMSAAILIPQYVNMLENSGYRPGLSLVIGVCLAGFSVFGGISLASGCTKLHHRVCFLLLSGVTALGASWFSGSCALSAQETGSSIFYLAAASIPLVVFLYALFTQRDDLCCRDSTSNSYCFRNQEGSHSSNQEKRIIEYKYICEECLREIPQKEYEQQGDIFCPECGGRIDTVIPNEAL